MRRIGVFLLIAFMAATCKKNSLYHEVEIIQGDGSGVYETGSKVSILAHAPDADKRFIYWQGDTAFLENPRAAATTFAMPHQNVQLRATYQIAPYYALDVQQGSGAGQYQEGALVPVQANLPTGDSAFLKWAGDTQFVSQTKSPQTTVLMPAQPVHLVATYSALPQFKLSVFNGVGSGSYLAGTIVNIAPDTLSGLFFKEWTGDVQHVDDVGKPDAKVTMPAQEVNITATFEPAVSFANQVFPLIQAKCNSSGCHDAGSNNEDFTYYQNIFAFAHDIKVQVLYDVMPPFVPLSAQEKQIIVKWVEQGAQNN